MKKSENFSEWYSEIVEVAGLTDKRYPIKGMNVWTPYGWKLMRLIDETMRTEMEKTGHSEVCFPLLIAEDQFAKEAEHIKGFGDEVYWVTKAGGEELEVKLLLRPTSETAMYPIFALWVRSHADLPLKTFQLVNTFRYDTKQTRAFIRVREIHFFEAHTCHTDFEDAERQIIEDLEIMKRLGKKLCLPFLILKRPDWDKFPGAFYSLAADSLMPSGRTMQIGTIHQYKKNFSKPYNIIYEDESGEHRHVHQTTYGMSERLVGAIVGVHGDDQGLIIPPDVAPYQVVIVPILAKGIQEEIIEESKKLETQLKEAGFRVILDVREVRPGSKYFDWEIRGVPLRLELGKRDMDSKVVTFARRDLGKREEVEIGNLIPKVKETLSEISENLLNRAQQMVAETTSFADSLEDVRKALGIVKVGWCGNEGCGLEMEESTEMKVLGTPFEKEEYSGQCLICQKPTDIVAYMAKTY
ncbi:MAG: proline--tRNA ligase [Thermoplasmata archaeon]|nr:MAG: proline--tRNA ligase [Thermoplasmata archaeon]